MVRLKKYKNKKIVFSAIIVFLIYLSFTSFTLKNNIEPAPTPKITLEDSVVFFSPEGFTPEAEINIEDLKDSLQYVAIKKSDSTPVSFPIIDAGEYYIKAFLPETHNYPETESVATLVIKPVEANIVVYYHKEKYNGIANPPKWKIEPEWAEEFIKVSETYYEIESFESAKFTPVETPSELGLYYVVLSPFNMHNNFICSQKVFVYEIGTEKGDRLSATDAKAVVPSSFKCEMEEQQIVYNGEAFHMPYNSYPAVANYTIEYSQVQYTGSQSEYTLKPPSLPGEYHVRASLFGQVVSESFLFIEKITPTFKIETNEYVYSPNGISPKVLSIFPQNVQYSLNAYLISDSNIPSSKPVDLPIKNAGKYLVIINPVDLNIYKSVFVSEYIEIKRTEPIITAKDQVFTYDGLAKQPAYTVSPTWVKINTVYYKVDDEGAIFEPLGSKPPVHIGDYIAILSVEGNSNIKGNSIQAKFSITSVLDETSNDENPHFRWLGDMDISSIMLLIGLPTLLISALLILIMFSQKTGKSVFYSTKHSSKGDNK